MGWLFCEADKASLVTRITHNYRERLLDQATVGNTLYLLVRADDCDTILVFLLASDRSFNATPHNKWGYKDLCESMGPSVVTCPRRLLDKSTCSSSYAPEWREACRGYLAAKAEKAKASKALTDGVYHFNLPESLSTPEREWFESYGGSDDRPAFRLSDGHWYTLRQQRIKAPKSWGLRYNPELDKS